MQSDLPKVLFPVLNRPMIHYVLDALEATGVARSIVVVGYRGDDVRQELGARKNLLFATQATQQGTGHAVMCAAEHLRDFSGPTIVLAGDSPMVQVDSLRSLLDIYFDQRPACLLGTLHSENPAGLGRILRDAEGEFIDIVEHKDANQEQRAIREVNMSTYIFDTPLLSEALSKLDNKNAQQEYYLTDCPRILKAAGHRIMAAPVLKKCEALSINTLAELVAVEEAMRGMSACKN